MKQLLVAVLAVILAAPVGAEMFNCNADGEHCNSTVTDFQSHLDLGQPYRLDGGTGVVIVGYHFTVLKFWRVEMLGLGFDAAARVHTIGENFVTLPIIDFRLTKNKRYQHLPYEEVLGPDLYITVKYAQKLARKREDQDHAWIAGFSIGW